MIYRRRIIGDIRAGIEIVPAGALKETMDLFQDATVKVVFETVENEIQIYHVELPRGLMVKPPDLREYAYGHEKIRQLVTTCVQDNCKHLVFEPLNNAVSEKLEHVLAVALLDLSSVMDLISVDCSTPPEGSDGTVVVTYEHKNGTCVHLGIAASV